VNRAAARAAGVKIYVGKPCPHGHDGRRYVSKGTCVGCAKEHTARQVASGYYAKRYAENVESISAYTRLYYERNRERVVARNATWAMLNPEKRRAILRQHKAKRRAQEEAGISGGVLAAWTAEQPKVCFYCGSDCGARFHVDHFMPLTKGGAHVLTNLRIACPSCNLRKNAKLPDEWIEEITEAA
jgi:5-methylcytosine-specific restriction endonuclease McrA